MQVFSKPQNMFIYSFKIFQQSILTQGILRIDGFLNEKKYSSGKRSVNTKWWASPHKFSWCFHCWGLTLAANNAKMWLNDGRQHYRNFKNETPPVIFSICPQLHSSLRFNLECSENAYFWIFLVHSHVFIQNVPWHSHMPLECIGPCQEGFRTWGSSTWSSVSLPHVHSKNVHSTPTGTFNVLSPLLGIWVCPLRCVVVLKSLHHENWHQKTLTIQIQAYNPKVNIQWNHTVWNKYLVSSEASANVEYYVISIFTNNCIVYYKYMHTLSVSISKKLPRSDINISSINNEPHSNMSINIRMYTVYIYMIILYIYIHIHISPKKEKKLVKSVELQNNPKHV